MKANKFISGFLIMLGMFIGMQSLFATASCDREKCRHKSHKTCKHYIKKDPIVGVWNIQQTGGTPINLSGQGVFTFHADGTGTAVFDYYEGVQPVQNESLSLLFTPAGLTWKKVGHNKYEVFASTVVVQPTQFNNQDPQVGPEGPYGVFPTKILARSSCRAVLTLSCDGDLFTGDPAFAECAVYAPDDLALANPVSQICCESLIGVRVGKL